MEVKASSDNAVLPQVWASAGSQASGAPRPGGVSRNEPLLYLPGLFLLANGQNEDKLASADGPSRPQDSRAFGPQLDSLHRTGGLHGRTGSAGSTMAEIIELEDFLELDLVEDASRFLTQDMPPDWWFASSAPGANGAARKHIRNFPGAEERIRAARNRSQDAMIRREFAFFFYRTFAHEAHCRCAICRVIAYLRSEEARSRITTATGTEAFSAGEFLCSRYVSGCFLSQHTDVNKGRLAVILSLSRSWAPEWGGLLHVMSRNGTRVTAVAVPRFNALACFTVPALTGRLHFVSHVAPGVPGARLAISGWYGSGHDPKT
jgi:hypothetical protein